jgi:hypothetical protein
MVRCGEPGEWRQTLGAVALTLYATGWALLFEIVRVRCTVLVSGPGIPEGWPLLRGRGRTRNGEIIRTWEAKGSGGLDGERHDRGRERTDGWPEGLGYIVVAEQQRVGHAAAARIGRSHALRGKGTATKGPLGFSCRRPDLIHPV